MASFFRPYFSLKLAASRTSAKWAADPGCEEAEPDDYTVETQSGSYFVQFTRRSHKPVPTGSARWLA